MEQITQQPIIDRPTDAPPRGDSRVDCTASDDYGPDHPSFMRYAHYNKEPANKSETGQETQYKFYGEVLEKIRSGVVSIDLLISPPRTGSTIMGKILAHQGGYDGYINEPGARFTSIGDERVGDTYKIIYDKITAIEQSRAADTNSPVLQPPIQLLIKDIAQHYGPDREIENLLELTQGKVAVLLRTPIVAIESMTLMLCELLEVMKGQDQHVLDYVKSDSDLSHIDFTANINTWQQHIAYMKATRDYSSLGKGFQDWWLNCNHMFGTPSLRTDTWRSLGSTIGRNALRSYVEHHSLGSWHNFTQNHLSAEHHELPAILHAPFEFRHGGWDIMKLHIAKMDALGIPYNVYDFTDMQCFPGAGITSILGTFGKAPGKRAGTDVILQQQYADQEEAYAGVGSILFGHAEASTEILPRNDKPVISPSKLPDFLQSYIADAVTFYTELSQSGRRMFLGSDYPAYLRDSDPIFTAVRQAEDRQAQDDTIQHALRMRPELSNLLIRIIASRRRPSDKQPTLD